MAIENVLRQINNTKITLTLTLEEAQVLRHYIEREDEEEGIPTDNGYNNLCPICETSFTKGDNYCPCCGQKVRFNDNDILPL